MQCITNKVSILVITSGQDIMLLLFQPYHKRKTCHDHPVVKLSTMPIALLKFTAHSSDCELLALSKCLVTVFVWIY